MRNASILALFALLPFALLVEPAAALQGHGGQQSYPAENFIVIVLDDVGTAKLSQFDGNVAPPYPVTPRLNQLANQGIKFTNFHVNPYCSATRACLQTGRYAYRTGIGGITRTTTNPVFDHNEKVAD